MLLAQGNNFRLKGDLLSGYIHGLEQALQALMLGGRTIKDEAISAFYKMIPEGKTSMLQDVEAGRKTEVEMFAGTMIELGKKYGIKTPYNQVMKDMLEVIYDVSK